MNQALQQILNQGIELKENDVWCKEGSHLARPENCTTEEVFIADKFGGRTATRFTCANHQ